MTPRAALGAPITTFSGEPLTTTRPQPRAWPAARTMIGVAMTSEPLTIDLLERTFGPLTEEQAQRLRDELDSFLVQFPLAYLCKEDVREVIEEDHSEWLARSDIDERVRDTCRHVARKIESQDWPVAVDLVIQSLEEEFAAEDKAA
jgi:hypothetical protein